MESTCIPLAKLETGLPSFNQVRLGAGIPLASHSNLTKLFTTTATMLLLPEIDGGTEKELKINKSKKCYRHRIFHLKIMKTICNVHSMFLHVVF